MKYAFVKQSTYLSDVFPGGVDGALVTYDENEENDIEKILECQRYSYDGDIYWYPTDSAEKLLEFSQKWFVDNLDKMDADLHGVVSNCLFYKKTLNGYLFVDSQRDMGSILDDMMLEFEQAYPEYKEQKTYYLSDCHLTDNLKLGRDSMTDSNETLYHLYKEKVLDNGILFDNFENILNLEILNTDFFKGNIVLTGTFELTREEITEILEDYDITVSNKVNKDSWLWVGDKPGKNKLDAAKKLHIKTSNVEELMLLFVEDEQQKALLEEIEKAIAQDSIEQVKQLVSEGFDVNYSYCTALVKSIEKNKEEIAQYLVSQGADVEQAKLHNSPAVNKWFMEQELEEKNNMHRIAKVKI